LTYVNEISIYFCYRESKKQKRFLCNLKKRPAMGAGAVPVDVEKAFRLRQQTSSRLEIYTAPYGYAGDDRVDVSFNGGTFVFTPPRPLLFEYRLGRVSSEKFQEEYWKFLERSFIQNRYNWDMLLESGRIVLVCSCNSGPDACHCFMLIDFLKKFGAVYCGDLEGR
jgi:hypothetical protein